MAGRVCSYGVRPARRLRGRARFGGWLAGPGSVQSMDCFYLDNTGLDAGLFLDFQESKPAWKRAMRGQPE